MSARPKTIAAVVSADGDKQKGTRFFARAIPLPEGCDLDQAKAFVAEARAASPQADKHPWAYRVAPVRADFRWSDDGEPIGSAGAPILQKIDALGLSNVLVVVSRWHGPKLTAGDLAHGYASAAREVLAAADIVSFVPTTRFTVAFDYADSGPVHGVLAAFAATHEADDYGARVTLVVRVPVERGAAFPDAVRDATAGRAKTSSP